MVIEVDESFIKSMYAVLQECAGANDMNGPASYMLAQELADLGRPVEGITLGELQAALGRVDTRYHAMSRRLNRLSPSGSE